MSTLDEIIDKYSGPETPKCPNDDACPGCQCKTVEAETMQFCKHCKAGHGVPRLPTKKPLDLDIDLNMTGFGGQYDTF